MYLMGHLGLVLLSNFIIEKKISIKNNKYYIGFASMIPDMVDKTIGSLLFNNGRWFGHSLLFLSSFFLLLIISEHLQTEKYHINILEKIDFNKKSVILIYIGSLFHLLGDWGITKEVVLWPLFGPFPPGTKNGFLFGLQNPQTVILEIIGTSIIVFIGIYEKWNSKTWNKYIALWISYATSFSVMYFLLVIL